MAALARLRIDQDRLGNRRSRCPNLFGQIEHPLPKLGRVFNPVTRAVAHHDEAKEGSAVSSFVFCFRSGRLPSSISTCEVGRMGAGGWFTRPRASLCHEGSGRGHPLSGTSETWMAPNVLLPVSPTDSRATITMHPDKVIGRVHVRHHALDGRHVTGNAARSGIDGAGRRV